MNILMATSEAVPFAKTGGLADVCGALPIELTNLGHQAAVILPAYRQALDCGQNFESLDITLEIPIGSKTVKGSLLRSQLRGGDVPVYLVQQDDYFDRAELYREQGHDYKDNCERFIFFSRAVMETIRLLELDVDVLHVNDWPTGLIPAYLDVEYRGVAGFENIATILTIHNMAYQGRFWHWDMLLTGIDWKYFNWHQMEFWGDLNLLKTGIVFSDAITTVSPRYALEIQSSSLGCGMEGVLQQRHGELTGIINGVDYTEWNPATDPHIAANFTPADWREGKSQCKAALQQEMGLPVAADVPLIGMVGRLASQKGLDLVAELLPRWAETENVQWAILGSGEPEYHELFTNLIGKYADKIAARIGFSPELAHRIEAGADMFLMPSRYEPCGLNQLYSLKYGTVPIVRATGGLADSITDANNDTLAAETANGFSFDYYDVASLEDTIRRACTAFQQDNIWDQIVTTGMQQDWSWTQSARQYVQLYQQTIARRKQAVGVV